MSFSIDIDEVAAVLLDDGRWYEVKPKTFEIGQYEFIEARHEFEDKTVWNGPASGPGSGGALWCEPDVVVSGFKPRAGDWMFCPVASIKALRITTKKTAS